MFSEDLRKPYCLVGGSWLRTGNMARMKRLVLLILALAAFAPSTAGAVAARGSEAKHGRYRFAWPSLVITLLPPLSL